jgi:hypothetical protein
MQHLKLPELWVHTLTCHLFPGRFQKAKLRSPGPKFGIGSLTSGDNGAGAIGS